MSQSIAQRFSAVFLAGSTLLGSSLIAPSTLAGNYAAYEPGSLRQAERALRRAEPARTLQILGELNAQTLKSRHQAEALGLSCRAHLQLADPAAARDDCLAAAALDRSRASWRFLNNLGVAELELGNIHAAEAAFERATTMAGSARAPRKNLRILQQLRESVPGISTEQLAVELR